MGSLDKLAGKHNVHIIWNFSATSHGKGPVDGVGAAVKRETANKIRTRQLNINNLDDFDKAVSNLRITKISSKEVLQCAENLKLMEIFESAVAIQLPITNYQMPLHWI